MNIRQFRNGNGTVWAVQGDKIVHRMVSDGKWLPSCHVHTHQGESPVDKLMRVESSACKNFRELSQECFIFVDELKSVGFNLEAKPQEKQMMEMPDRWFARCNSIAMREALKELVKKNGFRQGYCDSEIACVVGWEEDDHHVVVFEHNLGAVCKNYAEVSLAKVVEFLSMPQQKQLTAGGKIVKKTEKGIEVEGVALSLDNLKEMYTTFKKGPLGGLDIDFIKNSSKDKYIAIRVGCTTASAEEVEAIAKELKL